MHFPARFVAASLLWATAFGCALTRTIYEVDVLGVWVALFACAALAPSGWLIVDSVVQRCADEMLESIEAADEDTVERVAEKLADALAETHATPIKRR